jgi:hypothetical protein
MGGRNRADAPRFERRTPLSTAVYCKEHAMMPLSAQQFITVTSTKFANLQ